MRNLQSMSTPQRRFIWLTFFVGGLLFLVLLFVMLSFNSLNSATRTQGTALLPGVTVRQFAALPDDDAYPPAVAFGADGTLFTGSFASGTVWAISSDGSQIIEVSGTRDGIGSVSAIATLPDGTLLVLDVNDTDPRTAGGQVVRVQNGTIIPYAAPADDRGFVSPNDMVVTPDGVLFVTDGGRNEVWRFETDTDGVVEGRVWWVAPTPTEADQPRAFLTGIATDPSHNALLITDPETNTIYRVSLADGSTEVVYQHGSRSFPPGFDGLVTTPDGTIFVAAFGQNGIARVDGNELLYVAGLFRGASDVERDAEGSLYVPNFDQSALVIPMIQPQLPFAIDVVELGVLPTPAPAPTATP
ncbi:MAG: SMP-30/gluconolactonase/LRE family protein [Anaerolineae bacterium]